MSFVFLVIILLDSVLMGLVIGIGCCIFKVIGKSDKISLFYCDCDKVKWFVIDSLILFLLIGVILVIIGLIIIDFLFIVLGVKVEILFLIW